MWCIARHIPTEGRQKAETRNEPLVNGHAFGKKSKPFVPSCTLLSRFKTNEATIYYTSKSVNNECLAYYYDIINKYVDIAYKYSL